MSKNTQISELINYLSYDGSGNIVFNTVSSATTNTDKFLVSDSGVLKFRTAAQLLSDIGAQASGSYQAALSGTGFVKISGSTISYDNSTYATETYVGTAISNLVASSPATLDTLNELALALGSDPNFATTVATSIGTKQAQLNGTGFVKISGTTISYDNSTYALDSAVVKLAGSQTITGVKTFTGAGNTFTQNTNFLDRIYLRSASTTDYTNLSGHTNQLLVGVIGATHILSFPENTNYTYTFPAASGTLAFTSNLSSYLPLAGGTLTGALSGTSATFTGAISGTSGSFNGNVRAVDTYNLYKTGNATLGGQLAYDSTVNQLYLWNSISTGYFSIYTNSTERLNIGSDGTSTFKGPGIVVNRPTASSGEPFLNFSKDGVSRASIYGADGTAGLRFFSDVNTFIVNASSTITLTSAGTNASMIKAGSGDELYLGGNDTWQMRMSGGNILMDNGGNVSIGTSTIGYKLFVSTTGTGAFNLNSVNSTVGGPMIDFYDTGRSQETVITSTDNTTTGTYIASYSNHPLMFGANAGVSPTAKMTIATNGNVGIATVSPTSPLHIGVNTSGNYKLTHWGEPGFTALYGLILRGDSADGVFKFYGLNNGSESGAPLFSMNRASANSAFGTPTTSTNSRINVNGSIKINRSVYNWYQESYVGNSTYLHIKTNMWAGGSPNGNTDYTMSLFKGYSYSYGTPPAREGTIVFHNWDGAFYNTGTTGNLFVNVYTSADGYTVLVINSGSGESGVTIDWHQAYAYIFRDKAVSTSKLHGATTGGY